MSYQECREFVVEGTDWFLVVVKLYIAVSLAMARDGSSGGCVRMVNITKDKEEREFVEYNKLPNKMWIWYIWLWFLIFNSILGKIC